MGNTTTDVVNNKLVDLKNLILSLKRICRLTNLNLKGARIAVKNSTPRGETNFFRKTELIMLEDGELIEVVSTKFKGETKCSHSAITARNVTLERWGLDESLVIKRLRKRPKK